MSKPNFIQVIIGVVLLIGAFSVVKHFYLQPEYSHGEKAPDFISMLPDGQAFKLSELEGHYVLLDFWGSWCGPCIKEAPALIALHEKFEGAEFKDANGFAIVSVAIEKDKARWEKAIARIGFPWTYHLLDPVSNFKFFDSPIANLYGVKQLPTKFLINEKGMIERVDPSLEEVENFLQERI